MNIFRVHFTWKEKEYELKARSLDMTHPYFVSELEGRVMLDAARAVYAFFEEPPA